MAVLAQCHKDIAGYVDLHDVRREFAPSMAKETELLVEKPGAEDHPVIDLLTTDYTFLNERMAQRYGIKAFTAANSAA